MNRYYVEWKVDGSETFTTYIYINAYSVKQIRDMLDEYDIVAIDITDQETYNEQIYYRRYTKQDCIISV